MTTFEEIRTAFPATPRQRSQGLAQVWNRLVRIFGAGPAAAQDSNSAAQLDAPLQYDVGEIDCRPASSAVSEPLAPPTPETLWLRYY